MKGAVEWRDARDCGDVAYWYEPSASDTLSGVRSLLIKFRLMPKMSRRTMPILASWNQ
jgi:hypothetical protein